MYRTSLTIMTALFIITMLLTSCFAPLGKSKLTVTISAAASLTPFLDDIIAQFEAEHEHIDVLINYGSSGVLQKQIEQGAPIDLYVSAGKLQIDRLLKKNLLVQNSISTLLTNTLVVIEPKVHNQPSKEPYKETFTSLEAAIAKDPSFIALAEPNTVPAGIYAKQALLYEQLWDRLEQAFVYGKDVREVLAYVEQGNAELGVVYASDAYSSKKVDIVYHIPAHYHEPILYVGAVIEASKQQTIANQLLSYLQDERWKEVYEQNGFTKVD